MIRASDLSNASLWAASPVNVPATRAGARDAGSWFGDSAATSSARITGSLNPATRGLSAEQHASLVLAHLCGEGEIR